MKDIKEWSESSADNHRSLLRERKLFDAMLVLSSMKSGKEERPAPAIRRPRRLVRELLKAAAIIAVTVCSTTAIWFSIGNNRYAHMAMQTVTVPAGQRANVILADGTSVWLNAGTTLTYPSIFDGDRREVTLDGEAYFDVTHNEEQPFRVRTHQMDIEVLGTEFNVKCYADEGVMEATLVEGQVGLSDEGAGSVVLEPGEQAVVGEGVQGIAVREVNVQHYIGWRENRLSFQGETLEEIMQVLARWYDIEVVFEDARLRGLEFSGNLDKYTDIDSFFRLFELGAEVRFERAGRTVYVRAKRQ